MPSIPQVATAMETVLTEQAHALARETGFIQRERALTGAQFVQTLVFGWLANPDATYAELVDQAAQLGATITAQGLSDRFGPAAAALLEQVLAAAVGHLIAADPVAIPLLNRFSAVLVQDSTVISLPDALADTFRGCGGNRGQGAAALKALLRLDLRTGRLEGPLLQDGRAADRAVEFAARPPEDALVIRDLGFFQLADLKRAAADGRQWLSRLKPQTALFLPTGERVDLVALLQARGAVPLDSMVTLGVAERVPCRFLAVPVAQSVCDQRRRRLQREARRKGRTASAEQVILCGWTLIVTTLPVERLSLQEALVLLRIRWQIELLFKLWKSHGRIDTSRGRRPLRVLSEVYAKLIGMIVQHWLLLTGCWHAPDRSLPKAAKLVRQFAQRLANALHAGGRSLRRVLTQVHTRLVQAGRQTIRHNAPNAYQLLLDPSLLSLT